MTIGAIWAAIWNPAIWDTTIWSQEAPASDAYVSRPFSFNWWGDR